MTSISDRVEILFATALELPVDSRAAYLDHECGGDLALNKRILALLRAHEQPAHILDRPAIGNAFRTDVYSPSIASVGVVIAGRYKLLEEIGEGGMGTVWAAEQLEPVKRKVALKLIKAGMDSRSVLARFEAERQALALMDHPNIAKVFDGGMTDTGRPFFVMEYVKGVPITSYCDTVRLRITERLQLFSQVCSAVQHAHQKGIIHRDLKPSNILVAPYDDKPVPKVIDFGLAKAMHQSLTELTLHTAHDTVLGTPLYMSPEQAQLNNLDIDTRSDIYSLGVLLYELLTGTTPLEKQRFKEAAWDEIRRLIREEEPPRPSTRLSSTKTLPSLAACRQTVPAGLTKLIRGDLDWIVMKALEKQRSRRYETASAFAMDVERYLAGESVLAVPPSAGYRLRKFVGRHRPQVIAAGLVLSALLAGIGGTTLGLIEAKHQGRLTEQARDREVDRANAEAKQRERADEETRSAIRFRDQALEALRATTGEDVKKLIGSKAELTVNERNYLEAIVARWQGFAERSGTDVDGRVYRAEGHFQVASLWQKLGRREEARTEYQAARDGRKRLVDEFPELPNYQHDLADTRLNLGILLAELGRPEEALIEIRAALDSRTVLAGKYPTNPKYQKLLAINRFNYGALLELLGKSEEAQAELQATQKLQEKLIEQFPSEPENQKQLAHTTSNLGVTLTKLGKRDQAVGEFRLAIELQQKLVQQSPSSPEYQEDLADTLNHLGVVLAELGKGDRALEQYEAALDRRKNLAEQFPAVLIYQVDLGGSYCNLGNSIRDAGNPADSLKRLDQAVRVLEAVYDNDPHAFRAKEYLRNSHVGRAQAFDLLRRYSEAVKEWGRAVDLSPAPEQPAYQAMRALSRLEAGMGVEAMAEIAELTKSPLWNSAQWYNFACVYATASEKFADKRQDYAERAMELLHKAVKNGFNDRGQLEADHSLHALRDRADFKKLIVDLATAGEDR